MTATLLRDYIYDLYLANELLLSSLVNPNSVEYQRQDKITQQWFDLWLSLREVGR